ncbi:retention module-containing protein, partial [Billgrantia gudaonensis]
MSIATVVSITGQAWARDEDGNLRELSVGDTLQEGEVLVTSDNGRVQLDFGDGLDPTVVAGGEEVTITPDLDAEQEVDESEFAAMDDDIDALLAAVEEEDGDLLEALDATAAGAGGGGADGGGHDFVRLARISEDVDPLAFTFAGANAGGPDFEDDVAPADVVPPSASATGIELQDAETLSEDGSVATGVLDFSFGSSGAGSVSFAGMDGAELQVGRELLQFSWDGDSNTLSAFSPGRESLVFTVEVDPTSGEFTANQVGNLLHEEGLDEALAGLTFTVTSGDGSTAEGDFDVTILDDLPSITEFTTGNLEELTLTTLDAETDYPSGEIPQQEVVLEPGQDDFPSDGQPFPAIPVSMASQSLASFFDASIDYGADGPGTAEWSYGLSLTGSEGGAPVDSGLTAGGETIYLHEVEGPNGNMGIVGSTSTTPPDIDGELPSSDVVFALDIQGEGEEASITLGQFQAIDHPEGGEPGQTVSIPSDLIALTGTLTVTDADDDSVSSSQELDLGSLINFVDDEPTVDVWLGDGVESELATADAEVDSEGVSSDTAGFAAAFYPWIDPGADGEAGTSWSYALGLADGVSDGADSGLESDGNAVHLFDIDGQIVGSTAGSADGVTDGNTVFSLSVDGEGEVTLEQFAALDHGDSDSEDYSDDVLSLAEELVALTGTVTVTDGDGDTATDSASIDLGGLVSFSDDGPSISVESAASAAELATSDAALTDRDSVRLDSIFSVTDSDYGADGEGSTSWSYGLSLDVDAGTASGLTSGGESITLGTDGDAIVGSAADGEVFRLELGEDGDG